MMEYRVELFLDVCEEERYGFTMRKWIGLPFVPAAGMKLGLVAASDFYTNAHKVEGVFWHAVESVFRVRLEPHRWGLDAVDYLSKEGWTLQLPHAGKSIDGADWDPGSLYVVKIADSYYGLTPDGYFCLQRQGTPHEVHKRPSETGE